MPDHYNTVRYRCAKCHHRLGDTESVCPHCHWKVDPKVAEEMAIVHIRKRNEYFNYRQRSKSLQLAVLAFMAAILVVTILIVINSFGH